MNPLLIRKRAVEATMARFEDREIDYGRDDCVRMGAFHCRKMKRPVSLMKAGSYRSLKGSLKALRRAGFDDLPSAVDGQGLVRIAPAAAWLGDFLGMQGPDGWIGLFIAIGNGRGFGFVEVGSRIVAKPATLHAPPLMAWRV